MMGIAGNLELANQSRSSQLVLVPILIAMLSPVALLLEHQNLCPRIAAKGTPDQFRGGICSYR